MGRLPGLEEGAAGQCLALRGESSQVVKRDCRDNAIGKLETRWRARSPSAAGGSPGAWSRHSPRLCSTALGKVRQYADLEPEGAQASSSSLGTGRHCLCQLLPEYVIARQAWGQPLGKMGAWKEIAESYLGEQSAGPALVSCPRCRRILAKILLRELCESSCRRPQL